MSFKCKVKRFPTAEPTNGLCETSPLGLRVRNKKTVPKFYFHKITERYVCFEIRNRAYGWIIASFDNECIGISTPERFAECVVEDQTFVVR